jgi:signal peptide peptidase SppA
VQPDLLSNAARLFNGPALIDARHGSVVTAAVMRWVQMQQAGPAVDLSKAAAVPKYAQRHSEAVRYSVQDGIAHFPVKGLMGVGWNDYHALDLEVRTAFADEAVKGVLFELDTPGGLASKLMDFVDTLHGLRGIKPMWALVNELAASAGYAIASATDRIIVPRTAEVGSVGVVMLHLSLAGVLKDFGVEITPIFAGEHKVDGNWWSKLPAPVRERWEVEIAEHWDLFAGTVARNRNMDMEAVKATQALVYTGQHGVDIGFADEVMTASEAVAAFAEEIAGTRPGIVAPAAKTPSSQKETSSMADDTKTPPAGADTQAAPAGAAAAEQGSPTTGGDTSATKQQAPAAGGDAPAPAAGQPSADDAVKAERARVGGILGCEEAKGREQLANYFATQTDLSVDQAKAALAAAPKESRDNGLGAAMAGIDNPDVGNEGGEGVSGGDDAEKTAAAIVKSYKAASGQ